MHYLQTECAQKLRNAQNPKIIKGIRYYGTCRPQVSGVQADLKGLYTCVMVLICQRCSALSLILTSLDVWFTNSPPGNTCNQLDLTVESFNFVGANFLWIISF